MRRVLSQTLVLWAVLAGPAAAAQVAVDRPCPAPGEAVRVSGAGFRSLLPYTATLDRVLLGSGLTDGAGTLDATFPAPSGEGEHVVRVSDLAGNRGRATFVVRRPALRLHPLPRDPDTARVRFDVTGMGPGEPSVWAHWIDPRGRLRASARLGTAYGPCGDLVTDRRALLPRRPRPGTWRLQIDTRMTHDPREVPRVVQVIRVIRG